jgi:hypothetical protein
MPLSRAYIAGFVDGEGSIGFCRNRGSAIYPRVLVVNTNLAILEELRNQYGGDIAPLSRRKVGWKQGWMWRLSWSRAVNFLSDIQPWLRLKAMQAVAVFCWDAIRPGRGKSTASAQDERMDAHAYLFDYVRNLNKRGAPHGEETVAA